jgi:hypothetical protein
VPLAQRRLSIPAMAPLVSRDQAKWYAVTGLTNVDANLICRRGVERDSWNDLATAGTPECLNSKAGEHFVDKRTNTFVFLCTYIPMRIHAVGYRPHTALTPSLLKAGIPASKAR